MQTLSKQFIVLYIKSPSDLKYHCGRENLLIEVIFYLTFNLFKVNKMFRNLRALAGIHLLFVLKSAVQPETDRCHC